MTNYRNGAAFERKVRDALYEEGAKLVVRSAGSRGPVDLVAFYESDPLLPWAAGFFDGEGSTTGDIRRANGGCYMQLILVQKDPRVLHKFQSVLGVGKIYIKKPKGYDIQHAWTAYSDRAYVALTKMWPWLSEAKKEQARIRLAQAGYEEPAVQPAVKLVQAKLDGVLSGSDRETLASLGHSVGIQTYLAYRSTGGITMKQLSFTET